MVRASADALLAVINDVLDFSRIEAGKLAFAVMDFDLFPIIESAMDLFTEQAQTKGLHLFSLITGNVPTELRGDPGRFRQVLINLLSNAVKFTDKGVVTLRVTKEVERDRDVVLRFSVSDTGIGIPKDAQDRLFNAFSQLDSSRSRRYGGTGLGLAISQQLVKLMRGRIGVESKLGRGSTFWFIVPFEKRPRTQATDVRIQLRGLRVLLIGYKTAGLSILQQQLTSWRVHTCSAATVSEAKAMLHRDSCTVYDLAIIDVQTPTEWPDIALGLRSNGGIWPIPLILMTPLRFRRGSAKLREAGIEVCLTKPVKQSQLLDALVRLSGKRPVKARAIHEQHAASSSQPLINGKTRVLVVEDNATNRRVVLHQLHKLGYKADAVENGVDALEALDDAPYDIVLMDCLMPEMDGYEATKQMRLRRGEDRDTPIIAMTAGAFESDRARCFAAGMNDYLTKPIGEEELATALARWTNETPEIVKAAASANERNPRFQNGQRVAKKIRKLAAVSDPSLYPDFIARVIDDMTAGLEDLKEGLAQRDTKSLSTRAHTLKSVCGTIGAEEMMQLCEYIEVRARAGSVVGIDHRIELLQKQFPYVRDLLDNEKQTLAEVVS